MRKREKVKFYNPYIVGLTNLGFIYLMLDSINAKDNATAQVISLLIWCGMTAWGVVRMDKIIDAWDKNDSEEDE